LPSLQLSPEQTSARGVASLDDDDDAVVDEAGDNTGVADNAGVDRRDTINVTKSRHDGTCAMVGPYSTCIARYECMCTTESKITQSIKLAQ
jgi:hypothetical protein